MALVLKPTAQQEADFRKDVLGDVLRNAVYWIAASLDPEDVFSPHRLEEWARENGWKKPE